MSHFVQEGYQSVKAVPYDLPVVGYGNHIVNTLRIWDAEPVNTFNLDSFDRGDYQKAVEQENLAKKVLLKFFIQMITIMQVRNCVLKPAVFLYFCQCPESCPEI